VLIYPEIGMDHMTLRLASLRLAAVQVATWGHPETTGLPTIDYYLSADCLEPAGAQAHYTESLVKLPGLGVYYQPLPIPQLDGDLQSFGIDGGRPLLLNPGTPYKYSPRYDHVFVDIAQRLGDCQLIFFSGGYSDLTELLRRRLRAAFSSRGLDFDRHVKFLPWLDRIKFHALLRRADVFLDSMGFSGFNTAIQAVECGLPIVTREGRFMRGRLASAILDRMKLSDLVAKTEAQYIDLAVKLASDRHYRENVQTRMAQARSILYNDIEPVRALEAFLEKAVRKESAIAAGK
jgi:predicted O-linked N-acetylglucosamine transferase (SPINDLY family)